MKSIYSPSLWKQWVQSVSAWGGEKTLIRTVHSDLTMNICAHSSTVEAALTEFVINWLPTKHAPRISCYAQMKNCGEIEIKANVWKNKCPSKRIVSKLPSLKIVHNGGVNPRPHTQWRPSGVKPEWEWIHFRSSGAFVRIQHFHRETYWSPVAELLQCELAAGLIEECRRQLRQADFSWKTTVPSWAL